MLGMVKGTISEKQKLIIFGTGATLMSLAVAAAVFPIANALTLTLCFILSITATDVAAKHAVSQSLNYRLLLLSIASVFWLLTMASLAEATVAHGATAQSPVLTADDNKYFHWALHFHDGSVPLPKVEFPGYPAIILLIWKLTGVSLIWPLALNYLATLLSIVLAAAIALRLLCDKFPGKVHILTGVASLLMATQFHWLYYGTRLLKEPLLYLSVSLVAYALIPSSEHNSRLIKDAALLILGAAIMAVMRTTWMYFILLGIFLAAFPRRWQSDKAFFIITTIVVVAFFVFASHFARNPASYSHAAIVNGGDVMAEQFINGKNQHIYQRLLGDYFYMPTWHKALMLPITMAVQFFIPFPWVGAETVSFGTVFPRINFMWYAVGGVAIFYYLFLSWRKRFSLGSWALWPALSYVIIAFLTAGTVSRYVLPFAPIITVIATYVLMIYKDAAWKTAFKRWCIVFTALVAGVLVVCHLIQNSIIHI